MEGDGEGGLAEIVTLRPVAWIDQVEAEVGGSVHLELEEMDVRGMATVLAIEPCPPIAPGPGRVVLSTTVRYGVPVLALSLADTDEVLELTPGHRLFSEDRGDWVPAGELQTGERLRTRIGSVAVAAIEPKPGLHTVFNLEVETDHCYLVGEAQVLSHNFNPCAPPVPPGKPPLSAVKQALKKVHEVVGKSTQRGTAKMGSPMRGSVTKGYRLDPPHPSAPVGSPEAGPHINYWDWSSGKRGRGGISGAVPIEW